MLVSSIRAGSECRYENPARRSVYLETLVTSGFEPLTSVQAMLRHLLNENWYFKYEQNDLNRITKVFFSRTSL
jgi:hypothetical protein